jgi:large subunit ribosomal protein L6
MAGRLSAKPISVPSGVDVTCADGAITVRGPKGERTRSMPANVVFTVSADGRAITMRSADKTKESARMLGTTYIHTENMIQGVAEGFIKALELEGVGFRATMEGRELVLSLGFSHPVRYASPEGIEITIDKNEIRVSGIDKELVGQAAAIIRAYKVPEPYKGKGIRYKGEHIIRKAGKKAGVGS